MVFCGFQSPPHVAALLKSNPKELCNVMVKKSFLLLKIRSHRLLFLPFLIRFLHVRLEPGEETLPPPVLHGKDNRMSTTGCVKVLDGEFRVHRCSCAGCML